MVKIKQRLCPSEIVIPLYNQLKMFYEESSKIHKETIPVSRKSRLEEKGKKKTRKNGALVQQKVNPKARMEIFTIDENFEKNEKKSLEKVYKIDSDDFSEDDNLVENDANSFTCFRILNTNLKFKEIYQLLNKDMINDQVFDTFLQLTGTKNNIFVVNYFYSGMIFEEDSFDKDFLPM
ncbi:unnamed protein product, partial [Brachionus calyciflorus]